MTRPEKKRTKTSLRKELAFLDRKITTGEALTPAEITRWGEIVRELVPKPTKAEMENYRRQWIQWKRAMKRLEDTGLLDPISEEEEEEPVFEKSI